MLIFYSLILCLTAWLVSYLLMRVGERLERLLSLREPLVGGYVALIVTLALMVVVAAPSWVVVSAILITGFTLWQKITLIPDALTSPLLGAATILACVFAVLGGPHWLVIDAVIMACALGGVVHATRALPEFRASASGFVALQLGLFVEAALRGAFHAT